MIYMLIINLMLSACSLWMTQLGVLILPTVTKSFGFSCTDDKISLKVLFLSHSLVFSSCNIVVNGIYSDLGMTIAGYKEFNSLYWKSKDQTGFSDLAGRRWWWFQFWNSSSSCAAVPYELPPKLYSSQGQLSFSFSPPA